MPGGRAVAGDLDLRLHVEHHRNRIGQETGRSQVYRFRYCTVEAYKSLITLSECKTVKLGYNKLRTKARDTV